MATSGQVKTNTLWDSYFWIEWKQVGSQDIANNRTQIEWSCGLYSEHEFYNNAVKMSAFYINGVMVYKGGTYSNFTSKGKQQIDSGTLWINHGADGQKTFYISSFTGWLYSNYNFSVSSTHYNLDTITRKATITAAEDFTDQDNPSITVSNPGCFKMDVWLEPNLDGDHLCVRENITLTDGKYTWAITDEEREALRNKCPGKDCPIRIGVYTYVGGEKFHDYQDKKFIMVESEFTDPVVSLSDVQVYNEGLPEKFNGLCIQGKSRVKGKLSAEAKYGADIQNCYATVDGWPCSGTDFTSHIINRSREVKVEGHVVDTRGFKASSEETIQVIEYSKPLVVPIYGENAVLCYRSDSNGKRVGNSERLWVKAKRSYHSVSDQNTCALQWRWKKASEQWNDSDHSWSDLISTGNEYNALISGVKFFNNTAYTLQIRAIDDIGEFDIKTFDIPTEDVALHLGAGGKNVTVGTYCDYSVPYTFYSAWQGIFPEGINGLYIHTKQVTGEQIRIKTKFDDWEGTGEEYQTFILFGGHTLGPVFIVGRVSRAGQVSCVNSDDSDRFQAEGNGIVRMTLFKVADGKFTVISADPIEIYKEE